MVSEEMQTPDPYISKIRRNLQFWTHTYGSESQVGKCVDASASQIGAIRQHTIVLNII